MMIADKKYLALPFLFLIFFAAPLFSQDPVVVKKSENKVVLEGKIYYVHVVKKGETLYSIGRAYGVTEKQIIIENPGSSIDLIIGQVLKIPADPVPYKRVDTGKAIGGDRTHVIKAGETVYSISRKYNCTVEEILQLNPDLEINDLPPGQLISLPPSENKESDLRFDEEGFIFHNVKRGETLYSLSKYYGVSISEIRSVNTELGWGGPRSGDVLRIPKPHTTPEVIFRPDTIRLDTSVALKEVESDEEEYMYQELRERERRSSKMYRVAYLIPFNYSEMVPLDSLLKDVKSPLRRERITDEYILEDSKPKSVDFLEFLEGSLLAIDSLTDAGLNLDVHIYDTKRSMHTTRQILDRPEMKEMDLIIGPFYPFNLSLVSPFAKRHKIPFVTPFLAIDSIINDNPYLFQPVPNVKTEISRNAAYIGRAYDCNLILVHKGDSAESENIAFYKEALFRELEKYSALESVLFKEVVISNSNTDALVHSLNPTSKNLIILPTTDEAFASLVSSRLYYVRDNYDIELFGSSSWLGFNNIELSYIHALNLRISHTHWYDYNDPEFQLFLKKYRQNFFKEPSSYTRQGYSFGKMGYDLSTYFLSALNQYGSRFILHLDDLQSEGNGNRFNFERVSRSGGYENRKLQYYYFNEQMDVQEIDLPQRPPVHHFLKPAGEDPIYFDWAEPKPDTSAIKYP